MLFQVLGPLGVDVDGTSVVIGGVRPRALLTALLLEPNTVVSRRRLASAVWGDDLPKAVDSALHTTVARLRRALGPAGAAVLTRTPGYLLQVDDDAVDATRFEALHGSARAMAAKDPPGALRLLDEALALWRGPAYAEFAHTFARATALHLEELRLCALEERLALLLRCDRVAEAVAGAREMAARHPLRSGPAEVLMRGLHATGETSAALAVFRRHRETLAEQIGLEPSFGLRDLEASLRREQRARDAPAGLSPADLESWPGWTRPPGGVAPPAVGSEAAPPPSLPVPVGQSRVRVGALPWRPPAPVGRDVELARLRRLLATRRLTTVVGPAGVGKTSLALELAHGLAAEGASIWWLDLSAVPPGDVVTAVADAVGVSVADVADRTGALCRALTGRRGLLCLDGAERVRDAAAGVIDRLADALPDLRVLVTSREPLALRAELTCDLRPLAVPPDADASDPAVWWFADRAGGLDLGRPGTTRLVADLCRLLEGLPLALELAAAATTELGLARVAEELGSRLERLDGEPAATRRGAALRGVLAWSYDTLAADERLLLARLAAFPGACSLDQIEAVCTDRYLPPARTAPLIARLVARALVQTGAGRFRLVQAVRGYAREQLAAVGAELALRDRHARDTAARLAIWRPQLWGENEAAAVAVLTGLAGDLHAAWRHAARHDRELALLLAADVFDFAYARQRLDMLTWGAWAVSWNLDHANLSRAFAAAAAAAWSAGRVAEARDLARQGIVVAGVEQPPAAARPLAVSADIAMFEGRVGDALAQYRTAAALHRASGAHVEALLAEISVLQILVAADPTTVTRADVDDLLAEAHRSGNTSVLSRAYHIAGEAASDEPERAQLAFSAAVHHGMQSDNRRSVLSARTSSVSLAALTGPPVPALEQFNDILDQWEGQGNEATLWLVMACLVVLLARLDAHDDAATLAGAVLEVRERQPLLVRHLARLDTALDEVRRRLGSDRTADLLEHGSTLALPAALAHARRAVHAAWPE